MTTANSSAHIYGIISGILSLDQIIVNNEHPHSTGTAFSQLTGRRQAAVQACIHILLRDSLVSGPIPSEVSGEYDTARYRLVSPIPDAGIVRALLNIKSLNVKKEFPSRAKDLISLEKFRRMFISTDLIQKQQRFDKKN